jgi:hypothetical protein
MCVDHYTLQRPSENRGLRDADRPSIERVYRSQSFVIWSPSDRMIRLSGGPARRGEPMLGLCAGGHLVSRGPSFLKRDILFFDKLVILGGQQLVTALRMNATAQSNQFADEYEYLFQSPLFEVSTSREVLLRLLNEPSGENSEDSRETWFRSVQESIDSLKRKRVRGTVSANISKKIRHLRDIQGNLITRLEVERLAKQGILATSNDPLPAGDLNLGFAPCAGDIIRLSINLVPVPSASTPWQDIFALKADKDVVDRARKLRLWAIEQAKSETPLPQLGEKIADLLADYERALAAHKMKYTSSVLRSVIVGAAGVVEDIVKFRFEKAADRLFSIRTARADMLLAEASTVGKELSLVTKLTEKFGRR